MVAYMSSLSTIPLNAEILSRTPPELVELLLQLIAENQAVREEVTQLRVSQAITGHYETNGSVYAEQETGCFLALTTTKQ